MFLSPGPAGSVFRYCHSSLPAGGAPGRLECRRREEKTAPFGQIAVSVSNAAWPWQQVLPETAAASTLQSSDTCS